MNDGLPYIAIPTRLCSAEEKGIVQWRPAAEPNMSTRRQIWMPRNLADSINEKSWPPVGREDDRAADRRRRDCVALMTAFIRGDDMEVGTGDDRVDFKAMTPPSGQDWSAWELRPTPQRPTTRIFGVMASCQDFLAWACVPKQGLTPAAQTDLARRAVTQSTVVLGQAIIKSRSKPCAATLGGSEYGWWDADD